MDIGTNKDLLEFHIAQFLWIPLETATHEELEGVDFGPFARDVGTIP